MFKKIKNQVKLVSNFSISEERKDLLKIISSYIEEKINKKQNINLNFICTHNSRRSQFCQIWSTVAAAYYNIEINSFSGGTEVTQCDFRTIESLTRFGFKIEFKKSQNPLYKIKFSEKSKPIISFSKLIDDQFNYAEYFAAIITCSDADEKCPIVNNAEIRVPLRYNDPKKFDDTSFEAEKYDEISRQIACEMFYIFSKI